MPPMNGSRTLTPRHARPSRIRRRGGRYLDEKSASVSDGGLSDDDPIRYVSIGRSAGADLAMSVGTAFFSSLVELDGSGSAGADDDARSVELDGSADSAKDVDSGAGSAAIEGSTVWEAGKRPVSLVARPPPYPEDDCVPRPCCRR
jgi:hypothetical protein